MEYAQEYSYESGEYGVGETMDDGKNVKMVAYVHPDVNLKRPSNAYLRFTAAKRGEVKGMLERGEVEGTSTSILSNLWKNSSDEEKAPFIASVQEDFAMYNKKLEELGIPLNARIVTKTLPHGRLVQVEEDQEAQLDDLTAAPSNFNSVATKKGVVSQQGQLDLPPTKVKMFGTLQPHVNTISSETASAVAKAGEQFVCWMTNLAVVSAQNRGKRTIIFEDVARSVKSLECTQFLRPFLHAVNPATKDVKLAELGPDFDQNPVEIEERNIYQAENVPPGIQSVMWDSDKVSSFVPYITAEGQINVSGLNSAAAGGKKETKSKSKKNDERKNAMATSKKLESLARAKESELTAELLYHTEDAEKTEMCTE